MALPRRREGTRHELTHVVRSHRGDHVTRRHVGEADHRLGELAHTGDALREQLLELVDDEEEVVRSLFALNVRAPFFLSQHAAQALRWAKGSVNIADLAGFETWTGYVPHGMTKAAVVQMTRALAHALAPDVRVNGVAPGVVMLPDDFDADSAEHLRRTTPLQRIGTPEDVAHAVLYLLEAEFVTGEVIFVDGGRHVRR